jgi:hypothetical protein
MSVYLCKWSNGGKYLEWEDFKIQYLGDFTKDAGYSLKDQKLIEMLSVGDRLDLSDGISQYHEIERIG